MNDEAGAAGDPGWHNRELARVEQTDAADLQLPDGQLVDLYDPKDVARALHDLSHLQEQIKDAKRTLTEALLAESARWGTRTLELGDYHVELTADTKPETDYQLLAELLADAGCPNERIDELIVATVSYKLNRSVAGQLKGANPAYAEALAQAETRVPATVYANVRRGR